MRRAYPRLASIFAGILASMAIAPGAFAQATGYLLTVNTSSVLGQQGTIDLQFNAGALKTQNACVTISNFATDGTLGSPSSSTGSVTGTLANGLVINNGSSGCTSPTTYTASTFNDYSQPITFGTNLSFYVALSGPAVTSPAGNSNGNSGSSFGVDFTTSGSPALSGDPSNFAGLITLHPDGTQTTSALAGPGNTPSLATIQAAELVTVGTSPAGLSLSVDSSPYSSAQSFAWAIGTQHTFATTSPQGSSGTRYSFNQWSDGTTALTDAVTVSSGTTSYTASFNTSYLLTTSQSPSAEGSVGANPASPTNDGYYAAGTQVTLTAAPNTGYNFSNWTGTISSSTNPLMVTMNSPVSETANFVVNNVNATIGTAPSGLMVSIDGGDAQAAPVHVTWQAGSTHTISTTSPQGSGGTRYTFTGWSDSGALSHQVTASSGTTSYTASFSTSYLLTTAVNPAADGNVTANPSSPTSDGYYPNGTVVTLSATPVTNYRFSGWTGTTTSTTATNPLTVTMNSPVSETANFVLNSVNVTIGTAPTGLLVSVDNGVAQAAPVNVSWVIGSKHVMTTTSPQGSNGTRYTFTGWSDGGAISHQVTVSSATTTYTATFSASYLLTTSVTPSGSGSVTPLSGNYYPAGTVVNLKASANSGYTFQQWTGSVASSKSASTTITMSAPESVSADFIAGATVLVGTIIGEQGSMTNRQWKIGVLNVGPGAANAAQITSLSLVQTQGPKCTPVVRTSMPLALGNLAPGGTTDSVITIDFNGCSTNTRFAVKAPLSANNGKTAGLLIVAAQAP